MINSMTGYGRGSASACGCLFVVELRSVNHRFCEVIVRAPRDLSGLEDRVRRRVQSRIMRGRVEVLVSMKFEGDRPRSVAVDKFLALAYHNSLKDLASELGIDGSVRAIELASLPDLLTIEEPDIALDELCVGYQAALDDALDELCAMRQHEGAATCQDMRARIDCIKEYVVTIAARSQSVVEEYRQRLRSRISQVLEDPATVDETRLAQEVAILADRCSIDEELARLKSHIEQLETILAQGGQAGRKIEFLLQELNREVNTIGSKSYDISIARAVVDCKSELEKMREQAQNIE